MESIQDILTKAADDAGCEVRSYSGRGMYGKECFGIDCDNVNEFYSSLILTLTDYAGDDDMDSIFSEVSHAIARAKRDSMGLGMILYFPHIDPPKREDKNECDEDNED